ncbi:glucosaminyl-phosphatidylinositol-acyltransferase PIGW-like [Styela clava]
MDQPSSKTEKEAFVSGLTGTSYWEVSLLTNFSILLFGVRAFVIAVFPSTFVQSQWKRFVLEWSIMIFPIILITTLLSNEVALVFFTTLFVVIFSILTLPSTKAKVEKQQVNVSDLSQAKMEEILKENHELSDDDDCIETEEIKKQESIYTSSIIPRNRMPLLSLFRGMTMVISCIAILAVDFHIFPRRFAKAEVYGTGLMDTGVGFFIVSNGIVSPEARGKYRYCNTLMDKLENMRKAVISSWPLWMIGFCRIIFIKLLGYQEHVSEYGVHWNFFFTIAVVKVLSTFILSFISITYCIPFSMSCIMLYQYLLSYSPINLTSIILNEDRNGFLMANKEGICSCIGFLSLYFASVQIGVFLFQGNRTNVVSWFIVCVKSLLIDIILWTLTMLSSDYVQPVSRRFANLAYVLWILALCFQFAVISLLLNFFFIVCINWNKLPVESMPGQWVLLEKKNLGKANVKYDPPTPPFCLITAVNRNLFVFFLTSNICTGSINFIFDTMRLPDEYALIILSVYTFVNLLFIWILHTKQINLKFW